LHHFAINSETSYWFLALIFISPELYYSYIFSEHRTDLLLQRGDLYSS